MSKIFTSEQIRKIDSHTIEYEPVASIDLMERAARQLLVWFRSRFGSDEQVKIFAGPGNNGGDGWALARLLWGEGYRNIAVYQLNIADSLSVDADINRKRLTDQTHVQIHEINDSSGFPSISGTDIIIDGLFGSGLSRPAEGITAELIHFLNGSKRKTAISIDVPSGLFSENNRDNVRNNIFRADYTLSFQFPKLAFFFPENDEFVGRWEVLPIGLHAGYISKITTIFQFVQQEDILPMFIPRKKFSHKGIYGHALLIAGSYGMYGAAVLAARAAVRSGSGLVTTHIPRTGMEIIQTSVPESLISIDESDNRFSGCPENKKYTAVGIGPGLGQEEDTGGALISLMENITVPMVIDADGLNILADTVRWRDVLPAGTILTPHPKEFERLLGNFPDSFSRLQAQLSFSQKQKCTIVLKGAHTCITTPDGRAYFNSTGNPGMAKGGSGDVLTGIITGLLAQGYPAPDAAIIGVYIHGKAGDLASKSNGQTGMTPSDMIDNIGKAFCEVEEKLIK